MTIFICLPARQDLAGIDKKLRLQSHI